MTTFEALKVFGGLCTAFESLTLEEQTRASEALVDSRVLGFSEELSMRSAIAVVRATLQKLDRWRQQNASTGPDGGQKAHDQG